jgi:replicative DNA helicase
MGKTSWLLSVAQNVAMRHGATVAVFSLEMSALQLVQRLISSETGISTHRLRLGQIRSDEMELVARAIGTLESVPIYIDDTPGLTPMELRTKARRLHAEKGVDLIIVDYLQLMHGGQRSENRVQEISFISRSLKGLARELGVPVIAASQLSRAVENRADRRPQLSDLRESGSIEQDADIVLFLYRESVYNDAAERPNITEVHVSKHRHGPTGTVELVFIAERTRFESAALDSMPVVELP